MRGRSLIQRFKNRSSSHSLGLDGSIVSGLTRGGGVTTPTHPQCDKEPFARRSRMVSLMKSSNPEHALLFGNLALGDNGELKYEPWKSPLKGRKKSRTSTPDLR